SFLSQLRDEKEDRADHQKYQSWRVMKLGGRRMLLARNQFLSGSIMGSIRISRPLTESVDPGEP
ncbi:hypothetical protein N9921_03810, partial [Akkermansiaceae bacterium]|nr:hypothetical protein [Akkermansiaceae bacterium]